MHRHFPWGLKILFAALVALAAVPFHALADTNRPSYVEGEVLVRFKPTATTNAVARLALRHGSELKRHFANLSQREGRVVGLLHSTNTTAALLTELRADPDVELVEPNFLRYISDLRTPNDPRFALLWGLQNTGQGINGVYGTPNDDISFLKAWGLARPSTNEVVVGVIDTGLNITHPDIVSNLWTNPGDPTANGVDNDSNGYVDDVHGYDFASHSGTLSDSGNHGTHVSGTIAATGNNATGVIGVDFQAHIMTLKVSNNGSNFTSAAIVEAIQYATMMKARGVNIVALNASFGGDASTFSSTERSVISQAGTAGIVFCAAAGNDGTNNDLAPHYPANYHLTNMIVVAASDQSDALADFSDYGATTVDIAAPGVSILSLLPTNQQGHTSYVLRPNNVTIGALEVQYCGLTTSNGISGRIYYCGLGNPNEFPAGVSNNIALIQRGTLNFSAKVTNAMAAGAKAALLFNNVPGNFSATLGTPSATWIPALSLSQSDGLSLSTATTNGTVYNFPDPTQIYQYLDGTSMATPHVVGAVAFAAMNFPGETVTQRIRRILTNATPVAALSGKVVTGARLNLARIVDTDRNGLPDWWESQYFGQLTGVVTNLDTDHDGLNNLAEFLAGTIPTNAVSILALTAQRQPGTAFKVQWPSVDGRYYRLLRATNLATGFNTIVQTNLLATPPFNTYTDSPPATLPSAFYRLQLEP